MFGLVCGLASMLYVGNLILLPLGTALVGTRLLGEASQDRKARLRHGLGFGAGILLGLYGSVAFVIGESLPGVRRVLAAGKSILGESGVVLRHEATSAGWYAPLMDALTATRVQEYVEVWSLYGFFGVLLVLTIVSLLAVDPASRAWAVRSSRNGFLPILAGLVVTQLTVSFVKSRPMGWRDWDLFTYAAYPVNLLAACLLLRLPRVPLVAAVGRTFSVCASVWCLMVYAYMNPVWPEWSGLPPRRRASAFESYRPMSRIPASDAESRGIREVSPFP